jgi:hypothetical protein
MLKMGNMAQVKDPPAFKLRLMILVRNKQPANLDAKWRFEIVLCENKYAAN